MEIGELKFLVKSPLSTEEIFIKEIMMDEIIIYLDNDPIPYCIKKTYFKNILVEDLMYDEKNTYYDLGKLFLNVFPYKRIILSDINVLHNKNIRTFNLVSKGEIKKVKSHIHKRMKEYVEDEKYNVMEHPYISKKWQALSYYCDSGSSHINQYLIRLTEYDPGSGIIELLIKLFKCIFNIKDPPKQIYKYFHDTYTQSIVDDIDHLFYMYAKTSTKKKVIFRGMNSFYPYLKKPGDKMVIENYISCFDDGGGLPGPANIWCMITVEPGVPYIEAYTNEEFRYFIEYPQEKEVLLPRNLIATYIGETESESGNIHMHISVLPLNVFTPLDCQLYMIYNNQNNYDVNKKIY
jgi:hypothetical protein